MELQSILSFIIITEKFKLADLDVSGDKQIEVYDEIDTIDQLTPVFKRVGDNMQDEYFASQREAESDEKGPKDPVEHYSRYNPIYRTYFDFTDGKFRDTCKDIIDVQIRIQFTEPNQDTLGVNKSRRFLRTGQLQFLVITKHDRAKQDNIEYTDRRPLFEAFRIAQVYSNKYEGTDGISIYKKINKFEAGIDQYADLDQEKYNRLIQYLFPKGDIAQEVRTLNTGVARVVNLRFAELEKRTVNPIRITNPTYGLAVTIPFTFEQTR